MNFKFPFFSKKQKIVANTDQIVDAKGRKLSDLLGSSDDKEFEDATIIDLNALNITYTTYYESETYGVIVTISIGGSDLIDSFIRKYKFLDNRHNPIIFKYVDNYNKTHIFKNKDCVGYDKNGYYELFGDSFYLYTSDEYINIILSNFKNNIMFCESEESNNKIRLTSAEDFVFFIAGALIPNFTHIVFNSLDGPYVHNVLKLYASGTNSDILADIAQGDPIDVADSENVYVTIIKNNNLTTLELLHPDE